MMRKLVFILILFNTVCYIQGDWSMPWASKTDATTTTTNGSIDSTVSETAEYPETTTLANGGPDESTTIQTTETTTTSETITSETTPENNDKLTTDSAFDDSYVTTDGQTITTEPSMSTSGQAFGFDDKQTNNEFVPLDLDENDYSDNDSFPELKTLFNNSYLSDNIFKVCGQDIRVHSFVLSVKSEGFRKMFKNNYNTEIEITDCKGFEALIRFLYTEKFIIDSKTDFDFVKNVYNMSKKYRVKRLMKVIDNNLNKTLNLQNFVQVFEFAIESNMTQTIHLWREFVRRNSLEILENKLYLTNNSYTIECILFSMHFNEKQKLIALQTVSLRPDVNITRYKRLVVITDCDFDELIQLRDLKLLDDKQLLSQLSIKFNEFCHLKDEYRKLKDQCFSHSREYNSLIQLLQTNRNCYEQTIDRCRHYHIPNP